MLLYRICIFTVGLIGLSEEENILMVPVPFGSHVTTMVAAGKTLLRDGHDVTFLVADNFNDSLTKKGMKTFTYSGTKVKEAQDYAKKLADEKVFRHSNSKDGENLAMGCSSKKDEKMGAEEATKNW